MGNLAQSDDYPRSRQLAEGFLEERTAGRDLGGPRLVGGRQALDRVEDDRARELEPVSPVGIDRSLSLKPYLASVA